MNKFILYGAASIGNIVLQSIQQRDYVVEGYIDQRYYEIKEFNGLPVYSIDDAANRFCADNIVVYISVKNVFEHEKIARQLRAKGFKYIVYKPYNVLLGIGTASEEDMARLHDNIFEGINYDDTEIMKVCLLKDMNKPYDYAIIFQNTSDVVAYIPISFVYTNDYQDDYMKKWGNLNIAAFFTHIDFFQYLMGYEDKSYEMYLEEYCVYTANMAKKIQITDDWKKNVIRNRTQIYEQMRDALDLDPEFFVRNAATAAWNDKKYYFNLTSGKHRCSFQAAVGKKYIPLKISHEDYISFLNVEKIDKVYEILDAECVELTIAHPMFYRGIFSKDNGNWDITRKMINQYSKKLYQEYGRADFSNLEILDESDDYGERARTFARMGAKVHRNIRPTELELAINELEYVTQINYE